MASKGLMLLSKVSYPSSVMSVHISWGERRSLTHSQRHGYVWNSWEVILTIFWERKVLQDGETGPSICTYLTLHYAPETSEKRKGNSFLIPASHPWRYGLLPSTVVRPPHRTRPACSAECIQRLEELYAPFCSLQLDADFSWTSLLGH